VVQRALPRELRSRSGEALAAFAVAAISLWGAGCARAQHGAPETRSDAGASHEASLGARAEVVARADALAVEASRRSGEEARRLLVEAAELRERLFRTEHRETDALEALELWGQAAEAVPVRRCEPALTRAVLEAELKRDPSAAARRIEAERAESGDARCKKLCDQALLALSAFRHEPGARVAESTTPLAPVPGSSATPAPLASGAGPVVVPERAGVRAEPAELTRVERYGAKDAARVVIHVTHPALFEVRSLEASGTTGPRLVVDLANVTAKKLDPMPVGGLVERVRVGGQAGGTRVVLDLTRPAYRRVFYLPEPFRLVIDVSKDAPSGLAVGATGARSVRRVVLDPGHGGHDPGATGPTGLREKDVTLDVAHRAAPLLARELGISTLLTRDSDVYVGLDERTARANAFGADLLISIHCNASEDGGGKGVMSFVLDGSRDALSARVAARENAASAAAASELANALSATLDRGTVDHSERLAVLLQRATLASLADRYADVPDLGVRRAGFYVLAGAIMPAVLFETSFISNAPGEEHLNRADYRQKLADGIVNAVRAYREGR
jgi:N-acetylmuramoyl-L-alanine amidase